MTTDKTTTDLDMTTREYRPRRVNEIIAKPSQALHAMADGLERFSKSGFEIEMSAFGRVDDSGVCHVCAATCAVMELANYRLAPDELPGTWRRAAAIGLDDADLALFEEAMENARCGHLHKLFRYFGIDDGPTLRFSWFLERGNWAEQVPRVRDVALALQFAGF